MKILVIAQDLRISGTSEGIVSRAFLSKLKMAYPQARINLVYLKHHQNDDRLDLLPVDHIVQYGVNLKISFWIRWINKIYWRIFNESLLNIILIKRYRNPIKKIVYQNYDHIFIRSAGIGHETILACSGLPLLKRSIINFHDPYPVFWNVGSKVPLSALEFSNLKRMRKVVCEAAVCMSPARLLSEDMEHLYSSGKRFLVLPHQYDRAVFDLSARNQLRKKNKRVTLSYHGSVQLNQNIDILLDTYLELLSENSLYTENTEFVLRLKGNQFERLKNKYANNESIHILEPLDAASSICEQMNETDIIIILEIDATHSNILPGKAPFVASLNKPFLVLSPERSEMRSLIKEEQYIASYRDKDEIRKKLENLIVNRINSKDTVSAFGNYFSDEKFRERLTEILAYKK